ncbi:hypothetical protein HYPSUDRAFT_47041 [Hypholoma sublateritium FD-334 SS-4]|uniref:Uncharacterized protein n=1 Tax=Hypholoma sublateritium (strain FD-334 SS-4) TaxID=945553 RepID=A0A0D2KQ82_HYPSF|nr:hypothetical protein HYPSUDRAFT_47041 [Hypholoma sublateritium FD-334 SS-4]
MTCRSSSSVNLGDLTGCSCLSSEPSCALFPRSPDGKVILPNPLYLARDGQTKTHQHDIQGLSNARRARASSRAESDPGSEYQVPTSPETVFVVPSSPEKRVDNYAQLSSLPEFRAFKLNHNGRLETRRRANTESTAQKTKGKPDCMEEIRVSRRTKKQAYVRSGTHDFCIRLYSLDDSDKNKD